MRWLALLAVLLAAPAAAAAEPYGHGERTAYIERALAAARELGATGRAELAAAVYRGSRAECRQAADDPRRARCVIEVARRICAGRADAQRCELVADLAATNRLAENDWIGPRQRYRIMSRSADFRAAMVRALEARFAELAASFALSSGGRGGELGAAIDAFCVAGSRLGRRAWNRCVAALVWSIAGGRGAR